MALYDGFFDAEPIPGELNDDGSQKYDRAYNYEPFVDYFGYVIGTGVCVHNNPDSFRVYMSDGNAVVMPGYLFIQGYWLKNDDDYTVNLPGDGNYAIVAYLNLGKRMIELEARAVEQAYTDALVLAIVSPTVANDTRYNTDLCGVIDTAGELSKKVEWALNYIDNEIESKLAAIEQDIADQAARLDAKIAEVQAVADSIIPPPVGSIKFSSSQDVGEEWLPCDGRFVNEKDYPELVEALGKLIPSGDKFQLLSDGEIGPQISNGVVYGGRMWVYSYATNKLYGVDLDGAGDAKEIAIECDDPEYTRLQAPSNVRPIALSIVKSPIDSTVRLFLAQILVQGVSVTSATATEKLKSNLWLYSSDFTGNESTLKVSAPFTEMTTSDTIYFDCRYCIPYVVSEPVSGVETFYICIGARTATLYTLEWESGNTANATSDGIFVSGSNVNYFLVNGQRTAYSKKSRGEAVYLHSRSSQYGASSAVKSYRKGTFDTNEFSIAESVSEPISVPTATNIVGENNIILEAEETSAIVAPLKTTPKAGRVNYGLSLPTAARVFVDAGAYLWGKDIYMIFVGTGIIFSRTLEEGSFGYLDTTDVMGTITQFGYLDYSEDEGTLYLLGQDTTNRVKAAKIVLNTLYDYANDGAWLPTIAADGVPAYIKAIPSDSGGGTTGGTLKVTFTITNSMWGSYFSVLFNGEVLTRSETREFSVGDTFVVSMRALTGVTSTSSPPTLKANRTTIINMGGSWTEGAEKSVTLSTVNYKDSGLALDL